MWSCQNQNTVYCTGALCMHTLHTSGSLAFLSIEQVHYRWWLGTFSSDWDGSPPGWGEEGKVRMLKVTVLEGMVQIGELVVVMVYSYWELMIGIPEMDAIRWVIWKLPKGCSGQREQYFLISSQFLGWGGGPLLCIWSILGPSLIQGQRRSEISQIPQRATQCSFPSGHCLRVPSGLRKPLPKGSRW